MNKRLHLDALDAQIISTLLHNSRTKFVELAKNTQASTNTIRTRFNKLKKNGIITGSTILIDPKYFGNECSGEIYIQTDHIQKPNFVDNILEEPGIHECKFQIGEFNYVAFFALKNLRELDNMIDNVNKKPNVKRTNVSLRVDRSTVDYPENIVIKPFEQAYRENKKYRKKKTNLKKQDVISSKDNFDQIDCEILKILFNNSRIRFSNIAKKLNISIQNVIKRFNKLKKTVIHSCSITINLEKIGYFALAIFRIRLSTEHNSSSVFKKMLKIPNAIIAYRMIGDFQIVLGIPFKNMKQLTKTYKEIKKRRGVVDLQFHLLNCPKNWPVNCFSKFIKTPTVKII